MKEELQKWVVNIINTKESGNHTPRVIEEHDLQFFLFLFFFNGFTCVIESSCLLQISYKTILTAHPQRSWSMALGMDEWWDQMISNCWKRRDDRF